MSPPSPPLNAAASAPQTTPTDTAQQVLPLRERVNRAEGQAPRDRRKPRQADPGLVAALASTPAPTPAAWRLPAIAAAEVGPFAAEATARRLPPAGALASSSPAPDPAAPRRQSQQAPAGPMPLPGALARRPTAAAPVPHPAVPGQKSRRDAAGPMSLPGGTPAPMSHAATTRQKNQQDAAGPASLSGIPARPATGAPAPAVPVPVASPLKSQQDATAPIPLPGVPARPGAGAPGPMPVPDPVASLQQDDAQALALAVAAAGPAGSDHRPMTAHRDPTGAQAAHDPEPPLATASNGTSPRQPRPLSEPIAITVSLPHHEGNTAAQEKALPGPPPAPPRGVQLMPEQVMPKDTATRVTVPFSSYGPGHQVTAIWTGAAGGHLQLRSSSEQSHRAITAALEAGLLPGQEHHTIEASREAGDETPSQRRHRQPQAEDDA